MLRHGTLSKGSWRIIRLFFVSCRFLDEEEGWKKKEGKREKGKEKERVHAIGMKGSVRSNSVF